MKKTPKKPRLSGTEKIISGVSDSTRKEINSFQAPNIHKKLTERPIADPTCSTRTMILGDVGGGKSAKCEKFAEIHYLSGKWLIFDGHGAIDGENMYWCMSENFWRKQKGLPPIEGGHVCYKIILINPTYVTLELTPYMKKYIRVYDTDTPFRDIYQEAIKTRRIIVFNNASFEDEHKRIVLSDYLNQLPRLSIEFKQRTFALLREAEDVMPSVAINMGKYTSQSKNVLLKLVRESRHSFMSLCMDIHGIKDLFHSVRNLTYPRIICKSGDGILSDAFDDFQKDLSDYYASAEFHEVRPEAVYSKYPIPSMLKPWQFYIVYNKKEWKKSTISMPLFHHRLDKDANGVPDDFEELTGCKFIKDFDKQNEVLSMVFGKYNYDELLEKILDQIEKGLNAPADIAKAIGFTPGLNEFLKVCTTLSQGGKLHFDRSGGRVYTKKPGKGESDD